ncbi:MAG: DUF4176 domain-containing protein [Bacilli bacterium]|nr:DUF4176 domain-containing protein [Bacilli bacterium]
MDNYPKYLPLGTILMLKGGKHRVMIVGYCAKLQVDKKAPFYDYIGCLFPEGIFTTEETLVFNHPDIEKIYHLGYVDDEVKKFDFKLKEIMKKMFDEE